jgi:hypothetical protein
VIAGVLQDGQKDALDLARHLIAQAAKSIDGLSADDAVFSLAVDDLLERLGSSVDSGVTECFQSQHLLIGVWSLTVLIDKSLFESLFLGRVALVRAGESRLGSKDGHGFPIGLGLLLAELTDHRTESQPASLLEGFAAVNGFILARAENNFSLFIGRSGKVAQLTDGLEGLLVIQGPAGNLLSEYKDGVAGSGESQAVGHDLLSLLLNDGV